MERLVFAELGTLGSSSSSMTVIEYNGDVVNVSVSAGMRSLWSVLNALTLGERPDPRALSLGSFVSSKQKYPKI